MTVCKSAPQYSFFQHKSFPGNVYCSLPVSKIVPEVGSKWKVRVTVRPDKKKQTYGFCAISAEPLPAPAKNIADNEQENSAVSSGPVAGEPDETLAADKQLNSDLRKES
jgi:hypothetical protein